MIVYQSSGLDSYATESWLQKEVASAFDRVKADPSQALSLAEIRDTLAVEHAQAVANKTPDSNQT